MKYAGPQDLLKAYIGTLAVTPTYQNKGIAKQVLSQAEDFALRQLQVKQLFMVVITQRQELIAYYERRGYRRTGQIEPYPLHLNVGIPVTEGLTIEYLCKKT